MIVRNIGAVETFIANADEQGEDAVPRAAAQGDGPHQAGKCVAPGTMTGDEAFGRAVCQGDSIHRFDAEMSGK